MSPRQLLPVRMWGRPQKWRDFVVVVVVVVFQENGGKREASAKRESRTTIVRDSRLPPLV